MGLGLVVVIPLFVMALIMGVESWWWRAVFAALVLVGWRFLGPAWVVVPVALIIGIWLKHRLYRVTGSKV